ncbi:MAG: efflux RND transporter periplasmic adaptor subunit [Acidobacteria bacterium]|nr:efflux RND transporter periplasmic adaptor subunit [Acidobacteriota bacterium]
MKTLSLWLLFVSVGLTSACSRGVKGQAPAAERAAAVVTVSTAKPQRRELVDHLDLTATLAPYEQVTIYARVSGYLKSIAVDIGDHVRRGQMIAVLETPEMEAEIEAKRASLLKAQAAVEQSRAVVDQMRAEAEFAAISFKRLKAVHDRDADILPEQDVDQARAALGVADGKWRASETQVKVSEAAVRAAQAEISTLEAVIRYARLEAPIDGVVTERFVDPGDLIQTASASRTQSAPIVTMARIDRLRVVFDVPESAASRVHAGSAATVRAESADVEATPSRITRVAGALSAASRTMRAEIELANPRERLRPGSTAKVSLAVGATSGAITVPVAALRSEGTQRVVYCVERGLAKRVSVKTGLESAEWVQVVAGLSGDEEVILQAAGTLTDGTAVKVEK